MQIGAQLATQTWHLPFCCCLHAAVPAAVNVIAPAVLAEAGQVAALPAPFAAAAAAAVRLAVAVFVAWAAVVVAAEAVVLDCFQG